MANYSLTLSTSNKFFKDSLATLKANDYKHSALVKGVYTEKTLVSDKGRDIVAFVDACNALEGQSLKLVCCKVAEMTSTDAGKEGYTSITKFLGSMFAHVGENTMGQRYRIGKLFGTSAGEWKAPIPQDVTVSSLERFLGVFNVPKDYENITDAEWDKLYRAGATRYFHAKEGAYNEDGEWRIFVYDADGNALGARLENELGEDDITHDNPHFINPALPQSMIKKLLKEDANTIDGTSKEVTKPANTPAEGTPAEGTPAEGTPAEDKREKALQALTSVAEAYEGNAEITEAIASLIERIKALTDGEATPAEK